LVLRSVTFWTFNHALILAQVLATPSVCATAQSLENGVKLVLW
jgi:hypothetical protein